MRGLRPWRIVSGACGGPAVVVVANRSAQARLQGWEPARTRERLFAFGDWLLCAFLTTGVIAVSWRWPLARPHRGWRVLLHLFMSVMFCVAWATAGQVLRLVLIRLFAPQLMQTAMQNGLAQFWQQLGIDWLSWIFITLPFGVA